MSDVVHGECPNAFHVSNLVFHKAMKREEIGGLCKLGSDSLESGLRLIEQRLGDAPLMRVPLSARQQAQRCLADCLGCAALDFKETHLRAGTLAVMPDILIHNRIERHAEDIRRGDGLLNIRGGAALLPEDSWKRDNVSGIMGKKSIAIVAIVLLAFFVLGYVHGTSDAKQPDALLHNALRFSHFSLDDQKRVNLVYSCNSDIYLWNVGTKQYSITPQEARRRLDSGLGQPKVPVTSQRVATMTASLGGVAFAWSLKDAVSAIQSGDSKQVRLILITAAAAISGYGAGYALGVHSLPSCESDTMLSMLDDSISSGSQSGSATLVWKKLEKLSFEAKTLQLFGLCDFIEDPQKRESEKSALAYLYRATMQPDHPLSQDDMVLLLGGERMIRAQTQEHKVTRIEKILRVLTWLPFIFLAGAMVMIFVPEFVKWLKSKTHRATVGPAA